MIGLYIFISLASGANLLKFFLALIERRDTLIIRGTHPEMGDTWGSGTQPEKGDAQCTQGREEGTHPGRRGTEGLS